MERRFQGRAWYSNHVTFAMNCRICVSEALILELGLCTSLSVDAQGEKA